MILFLLYICLNYISNQNGKVQEETLAYSNSDAVKTTLILYVISKDLSSFSSYSKISPHFSVTLSLAIEIFTNGSVS